MTELSLSAINATAPYRLRKSELGGFDFDVDAGLTYNIALIEDYTFGDSFETFMLNVLPHSMEEYNRIKRDRSVKMRRDDKIRKTVMAVLEEAMRHQNIIIDYVCMSEDERQDFRARLFLRWTFTRMSLGTFIFQNKSFLDSRYGGPRVFQEDYRWQS